MVDPKLVALLRCPIDGADLEGADDSLVTRVNQAIAKGDVRDRHDQKILDPIDDGLVNPRLGWLYPVRGGIPSLVADEAIEIAR